GGHDDEPRYDADLCTGPGTGQCPSQRALAATRGRELSFRRFRRRDDTVGAELARDLLRGGGRYRRRRHGASPLQEGHPDDDETDDWTTHLKRHDGSSVSGSFERPSGTRTASHRAQGPVIPAPVSPNRHRVRSAVNLARLSNGNGPRAMG